MPISNGKEKIDTISMHIFEKAMTNIYIFKLK